jgi:hypothetical protein
VNLDALRRAVRAQLDLDEEDLQNPLVDLFLREAFEQTINLERRWPFYETYWDVSADDGKAVDLPEDVAGIASVLEEATRSPLLHVSHQMAEENFRGVMGHGRPRFFSVWGRNLYLWPGADQLRAYTIRGYRKARDWVSEGASAEVDADERLHLPLVHYACSRAYAQQEDEVLSATYLDTWSRTVEAARQAIMRPSFQGLSQLGYGFSGRGPARTVVQLVVD